MDNPEVSYGTIGGVNHDTLIAVSPAGAKDQRVAHTIDKDITVGDSNAIGTADHPGACKSDRIAGGLGCVGQAADISNCGR